MTEEERMTSYNLGRIAVAQVLLTMAEQPNTKHLPADEALLVVAQAVLNEVEKEQKKIEEGTKQNG